jgi:demethylmenaquinone methyltransferase/2-methoxy-6-polyprenyl-1,4-benzoquinol methylase
MPEQAKTSTVDPNKPVVANVSSGVRGTTPAGTSDERSAAQAVRQMFDEIAPRYDFLNHVLSRNNARVLDLCAGTGDMSVAMRAVASRQKSSAAIVALDFSHQMLQHGLEKFNAKKIQPVEADALHLPLTDNSVDLVVSSFGFRNLANYDAGLREIFRVLKPQGEVGILDFSEPGGLLGKLYGFYFRKVLPRIGTMISGVRGPYEYLPASVHKFPAPQEMLKRMESVGFHDVDWTPYTFAIAGLYRGKKR